MNVFDPLYGGFVLPQGLEELIQVPEVRRLSQIRLLNSVSPSLATLGELRRYSHTLGVLRLAIETPMPFFSEDERRAFLASVVLHDIGTPAFGHLLEYELRERTGGGWHHEGLITNILWGFHSPENRAHQIFGGREIKAFAVLRRLGISLELVGSMVGNKHPLSKLLFGSLDLDNLDNVARMAWSLGLREGREVARQIASGLHVSRDGDLLLDRWRFLGDVSIWAELRRKVYEVIVFDPETVAAQAVLTEAIRIALDKGLLTLDDWGLYDEVLLERLQKDPDTKRLISRQYLGQLPSLAFSLWVPGSLADIGFGSRSELELAVRALMETQYPMERVYAYVFVDKGTFSKDLRFRSRALGEEWEFGTTSRSVVLSGFVESSGSISARRQAELAEAVRRELNINEVRPLTPTALNLMAEDEPQIQLPFPA